jgi:O-methyltransferase involved in polyketide biosynthesis
LDRYAQDLLRRHTDAVVVHIGCGLDSRFERVDNGHVEWYDLDMPEIIELRRKRISVEGERYHIDRGTRVRHTGQVITVDGSAGTVTLKV